MHTTPPAIAQTFDTLLSNPAFQKAMAFLEADEPAKIAELKEMVVVQGAPFKEHLARSPMYKAKLEQHGAEKSFVDAVGNVLGFVTGTGEMRPKILVEGHLDTVFAEETPLAVTEQDGWLFCPGIGDDTAALACNLSILRAIRHAGLKPVSTLIFGGTVGEEGEGNARGIRHIMREHNDIDTVISVESKIFEDTCLQAVGIRRHECIFTGPGGHSWRDFGVASPIHAMGRAIAHIADIQVPTDPRTTFSVSIVNGGSSINSIPHEARLKIDMRSVDLAALHTLEEAVFAALKKGVAEENARWKGEGVAMTSTIIGDKPAGTLPTDSLTAQIALSATHRLGVQDPKPSQPSSTNQNIPISMGVPSLVVGAGGQYRGVHKLTESHKPADSCKAAQKLLLMLFAMAGLDGVCAPLAKPCLKRGPVL